MRLETAMNLGIDCGIDIRGSILLCVVALLLKHILLVGGESSILVDRLIETFHDATSGFGHYPVVESEGGSPELAVMVDLVRFRHYQGRSNAVTVFREKTLQFHGNAQVGSATVAQFKGLDWWQVLMLVPGGPGRLVNVTRERGIRRS